MKRSSLGLVAFAGALLLTAGNARAATLTVTTLSDSGRGSLRQAIERANRTLGADTIVFAPRLRGTLGLKSSLPSLKGSLSIIGPGRERLNVRRTGKTRHRILAVAKDGIVLLSGLTLSNGFSPITTRYYNEAGGGGGVRNEGILQMNDCAVTGNRSDGSGGGVFNIGPQLTLTNCLVTDNQCLVTKPKFGEEVYDITFASGGGGLYNNNRDAELLISNSTFSRNVCLHNGSGGAIKNASEGKVHILRSTLTHNTAFGGGALDDISDNDGSGGDFEVTESLIAYNTARKGGAIRTNQYSGKAILTNCTVSGNKASDTGGAIFSGHGGVELSNCTITGNVAPKGAGVWSQTASYISGCIIVGNLLPSHAPGMDIRTGGGGTQNRPSTGYNFIGRCDANSLALFHETGDRSNVSLTALKLGRLADNGGPTKTHALLPGSSAISKGNFYDGKHLVTDQRGVPRFQKEDGNTGDVGAFQTIYKASNKTKK